MPSGMPSHMPSHTRVQHKQAFRMLNCKTHALLLPHPEHGCPPECLPACPSKAGMPSHSPSRMPIQNKDALPHARLHAHLQPRCPPACPFEVATPTPARLPTNTDFIFYHYRSSRCPSGIAGTVMTCAFNASRTGSDVVGQHARTHCHRCVCWCLFSLVWRGLARWAATEHRNAHIMRPSICMPFATSLTP